MGAEAEEEVEEEAMSRTIQDELADLSALVARKAGFNPNQVRDPRTGEWVDMPGLPNLPSGPWGGSEDSAAGSEWNTGGCGEFAVALQALYPDLKLGGVYIDPNREYIGHAWAYDEKTGTRFDIFGAQPGIGKKLTPGETKSGGSIGLDLSRDDLAGGGLQIASKYVEEAKGVAREMFG